MASGRFSFSAGGTVRISLAAGFTLVLGVGLPGHMSVDSVVQLFEGRTGVSESFHPPLMSLLLGVFDAIVPGTGVYVAFNVLLLFASLWAIPRLHDRVSWLATPIAL